LNLIVAFAIGDDPVSGASRLAALKGDIGVLFLGTRSALSYKFDKGPELKKRKLR